MKRPIFRIVALLLSACLVADPICALEGPARHMVCPLTPFAAQALSPVSAQCKTISNTGRLAELSGVPRMNGKILSEKGLRARRKKRLNDDDSQSINEDASTLRTSSERSEALIQMALNSPDHFGIVTNKLLKILSLDEPQFRERAKAVIVRIGTRLWELSPTFRIKSTRTNIWRTPAETILSKIHIYFLLGDHDRRPMNPEIVAEHFPGIRMLDDMRQQDEAVDLLVQFLHVLPDAMLKDLYRLEFLIVTPFNQAILLQTAALIAVEQQQRTKAKPNPTETASKKPALITVDQLPKKESFIKTAA